MVVVKKIYRRENEDKLVTFSTTFNKNLFLSTATYPSPPVTETVMEKAIQDYEDAAETWRAERSDYNAGQTHLMRKALIEKLDTQVDYVELNAPDQDSLRALGLQPAATKRTKAPLPGKPEGAGAKLSDEPRSVVLFCDPVRLPNGHTGKVSYYVFETNADGTEQYGLMNSGTNSQRMAFGGLTTGKVHFFYIRAKTTAGFGPPSKVVRWVGQ